jgi:Co/Zn/Cd efflux system component
MSANCCTPPPVAAVDPVYRRILWIALVANAAMFFVEIGASALADSTALLADAVDFFGDAANYGISLAVLALAPVWRSRAALIKGCSMGLFGIFVIGKVLWSASTGSSPEPLAMGAVAILALLTNVGVAVILYRYRSGDANMRSVWLCSRNDAIGNVAVLIAALGVFGTGSGWPDLAIAAALGILALSAAQSVVRQSLLELKSPAGNLRHDPSD